MSWDIYLSLDPCQICGSEGSTVYDRNITYNNSKILSYLDVHPDFLKDKHGIEIADKLLDAYEDSFEKESKLLELEPPNKWGGLEDCRDFIHKLQSACFKYPKAKVHIT